MKLQLVRYLLAAALAAPMLVTAHDPSQHKGKATQGEVVSVARDRLELKTAAGMKTVIFNDKTKVERGNQTITTADLKKGDQVLVYGTTLATGELVSREILIGKADPHAARRAKHDAK